LRVVVRDNYLVKWLGGMWWPHEGNGELLWRARWTAGPFEQPEYVCRAKADKMRRWSK